MGSEARDSHNYILTYKGKLKHCGVLLAGHWKEVWCYFSSTISEDASNDPVFQKITMQSSNLLGDPGLI